MATGALAQEAVIALRREIARIEGTLPERLDAPGDEGVVLRRAGVPGPAGLLRTGAPGFDVALGGGLPQAALIEIHATETRDAGAAAGFTLGLSSLLLKSCAQDAPLLWIGTREIFREAGFPYSAGLLSLFGIEPGKLLLSQAEKLADALWVAEEAARLKALSAVIVELRGNPEKLDLTATRRLHRRALDAGRPVFLLRQGACPEPTAAPLRLIVSPSPAALRSTLAGPLQGSIGPPSFAVSIDKSRSGLPGRFTFFWNRHERSFEENQTENPGAVVPLSLHGTDMAAASGTVLAFDPPAAKPAARHQPSREQHAKDRRARRAG